jgi:hypothetical protein
MVRAFINLASAISFQAELKGLKAADSTLTFCDILQMWYVEWN